MTEGLLAECARRCLPALEGVPLEIERIPGGGNNRLYRIATPDGRFALKHYFHHPEQPRDRLGSEFVFLAHAWDGGVRCIPRPFGKDEDRGAGLYGFVPGRQVAAAEVGRTDVLQALDFLAAVNAPRAGARALGPASEACFSVEAHIQMLEGRIGRLLAMEVRDDLDAEAARLVRQELEPAWRQLRASIQSRLRSEAPPPWALSFGAANRVISPSDFGFHNALRGEDGRLAFLDFEYAGWDDPAKLVCDFFFQMAVPAPRRCFDEFARGVAALVPDGAGTLARVELLRPLFGLKWCCIVLNHFTRIDLARRAFAASDAPNRKAGQLEKARRLLDGISWKGE